MATLRLGIDARGARSGARDFTRATGKVTKGATTAGKAVRGLVGTLTAGVAIRATARIIGQFEESIVTLGAVSRATETQLAELQDTARTLGATTRFSALEAAEGLTFLARAGFDANQSMQAIGATLDLAQVGLIDLGRAADIASNVVSQFSLDADKTVEVVDALVIVSNRANTNVLQLSEALKFAGPVAGAFGNTVEQTAAALGVLGDRGIQGTLAGTGLRTALLKLADPTSRARETIEALGLSVAALGPEANDIVTIFGRLGQAQASATDLGRIFGARTAATAIILSQSTDRVRELEQATKDYAGEAAEIARLQDDTLPGSFKALTSAATELILSLGDGGLGGAFKSVTVLATDTLRVLAGVQIEGEEASGTAKVLAFALKGTAIALGLLAAVKVSTFLAGLAADLVRAIALQRAFASAIDQTTRVAGLQRALQALSSPLGLVITGASLAAAAFIDFGDEAEQLEERLKRAGAGVNDLTDAIERLQENRAAVAQAAELGDLEGVARGAANEIEILNTKAKALRVEIEELGAGATTDLGQALAIGLEQADLDFLARSARLELRNAFAAAAEDNIISGKEVADIKATFGTLFDDQDGIFGDSVEGFLDDLRTGAKGISSGQGAGFGNLFAADINPDDILLRFEQRFDQARVRTSDVLDLINGRIRGLGTAAGDAGDEVGEALGDDLADKLERLQLAANAIDLEGSLVDPALELEDAINAFNASLAESGVELDQTSTAANTLQRALEQLLEAEEKLGERQAKGRASLEALRQGLQDERQEVGLGETALNKLRLERQLGAIEQQGEIEISAEARDKLLALREEIDRGRVVQAQADQAAQSFVTALSDFASGASSAEDAAKQFFLALQQQLLQQFALQPLTELISSGIASGTNAVSGLIGAGGDVAGEAATEAATAATETAATTAITTAIVTASTADGVAMATQTTALTAALSGQTVAITGAIAAGGAADAAGGIAGAAGAAASAFGNAFTRGGQKVGRLQNGGVLDSPGIAQLGNGALTTFAEREPEGILPLRRGRGGRLGVEVAGGGGGGNVTNNNNTTIITPNADSFRKSGRQAAGSVRRTARL